MSLISTKQNEVEDREEMRLEEEEKEGRFSADIIERISISVFYRNQDDDLENVERTAQDFEGAFENLGKLQRYIEKQI